MGIASGVDIVGALRELLQQRTDGERESRERESRAIELFRNQIFLAENSDSWIHFSYQENSKTKGKILHRNIIDSYFLYDKVFYELIYNDAYNERRKRIQKQKQKQWKRWRKKFKFR